MIAVGRQQQPLSTTDRRHRKLSLDLELRRMAPAGRPHRQLVSWNFLTCASYRPSVSVAATGVLKYRAHSRTSSVDVVALQRFFFHCIICIVHSLYNLTALLHIVLFHCMVVLSFHRCGVFATFHRSGLVNSTSQPGVPIVLHFDF